MSNKIDKISSAVGGRSMNTHRILMLMLMTAAVCVMSVGVGMRLSEMFLKTDLDVPLGIARAKEGMSEEAGG